MKAMPVSLLCLLACIYSFLQIKHILLQHILSTYNIIKKHPGFNPVCINRWFLQAAWYQYKQQCKESFDGPEDKLYRHKTYKQLA